ncbi:MAG: hypothetical protein M3023_05825 [Pseudomonadota bacterium]|nr:hypothetical protein [Pseudomonadota bacterium]
MRKHLDPGTQVTLAITLLLFVVALFEKGFTHDLLLEAGVFLVSAKLVLLSYKASVHNEVLESQLVEMSRSLTRIERCVEGNPTPEASSSNH